MKIYKLFFLSVFIYFVTVGCNSNQNDKVKSIAADTTKAHAQHKDTVVKKKKIAEAKVRFKSNAQTDSDEAFYHYVHESITKVGVKDIMRLVDTVDSYYNQNNASFGEYNPTMMYFLLEKRTQDLMQCLYKVDTTMLNNWLLSVIASPVYPEKFDVVILKVKNTHADKVLKNKVIKAIQEARDSMKKYGSTE